MPLPPPPAQVPLEELLDELEGLALTEGGAGGVSVVEDVDEMSD